MTLEELFNKIEGAEYGTPQPIEKINEAENELNLKFANDYKEFLQKYGGLSTKYIDISNLDEGFFNVCDLTKKLRNEYCDIDLKYYVLYEIKNGEAKCLQDSSGKTSMLYKDKLYAAADSLVQEIYEEEFYEE